MFYCSKCGKEAIEGSSFCQHCGGSLSPTQDSTQTASSGLTNEDFRTFIGKNSEKYLAKFAKFNADGADSFKATWHWPALFVPFWWMIYRKMYGWAALAFVLGIIPYVGLLTGFVWAIVANYLYYNHAKKKLLEIKQLHPAPETQKAVITVTGGTGNAVVIIGAVIGIVFVIGILAAIAIPAFLGQQEKARKKAIESSVNGAVPELQSWLLTTVKGKDRRATDRREIDTDGNGVVNDKDLKNSELLNKGVCDQFVTMKTSAGKEKSPWDVNVNLWSMGAGGGQIQCMQSADNQITLTATDKKGAVITTKTITAE